MTFTFKCATLLFVLLYNGLYIHAQGNKAISEIIKKIHDLEKDKDPKCYATANRLEDFMYGTPLDEDARNLKIEIQKEIIYYLKEAGTFYAIQDKKKAIEPNHIIQVLNKLVNFSQTNKGDYVYHLTTGSITVLKKDMDQYKSVSYGYRSLLSVEQDLIFMSDTHLLNFNSDAINLVYDYVNLITLVTLKIADLNARKANENFISKKRLKESWLLILNESKNTTTIAKVNYPTSSIKNVTTDKNHNSLVKEIIAQKMASYTKYNNLAESVFLRNVQVYFARQKWPTTASLSNELRTYYLESLIQYTISLLNEANKRAAETNSPLIRPAHVMYALQKFLPSETNNFEDVTFFPNSGTEAINIESYDLDSFRDSGFHWQILGYAIDDMQESKVKNLDPNAAEQLVEGIAQMGVLALRLAGEISHKEQKEVLDKTNITSGFQWIQDLISDYDFSRIKDKETKIISSSAVVKNNLGFVNSSDKTGINFEHKSSDWLNRFIRSYATSSSEGVIKLAIPPAFGGSGVACEDINNDGLMDILLLGGFGNKLYLNTKEHIFKDVTAISKINSWNDSLNSYGEVRQPIIADFNNDGMQDIFITYVNDSHKMYRNSNGVEFEDVSAVSGLGGGGAVAGPATAFDYNNDGLLDLFIGYFGNYIDGTLPTLSRDNQNGLPNKLFKNLGNFKFEEVSFTANEASNKGWTQAIGHTDLNQDGYQDLVVGNDFGKNKYYLNQNGESFAEISTELGTDKPSYTMNVGITDLNGDLFPDLYISNIVVMQKDEKYVSPNADTEMKFDPDKMANIRTIEANDLFISSAIDNKLSGYKLSNSIGRGYSATGWSWDADFFDFDNDGDDDLYCLNGMNDFSVYSSENPFYFERSKDSKTIRYAESNREKNVFFVNENGQLVNKAEELGADLNSNARSASYFDYDNDGDLDIIINNYHEKATLLENKTSRDNNWIKIKLIGNEKANINRDAIGSTLYVITESKKVWREVHSTTGYLSVHPKEQHFGLGIEKVIDLEVKWSNGESYKLRNIQANAQYEITYPDTLVRRN